MQSRAIIVTVQFISVIEVYRAKVSCTHVAVNLCSSCCFCVAISNVISCVDGAD